MKKLSVIGAGGVGSIHHALFLAGIHEPFAVHAAAAIRTQIDREDRKDNLHKLGVTEEEFAEMTLQAMIGHTYIEKFNPDDLVKMAASFSKKEAVFPKPKSKYHK